MQIEIAEHHSRKQWYSGTGIHRRSTSLNCIVRTRSSRCGGVVMRDRGGALRWPVVPDVNLNVDRVIELQRGADGLEAQAQSHARH
jgi:hypothetical protein